MPKSVNPRTALTRGVARRAETIGYVTWSSIRSGLRPSHSVAMMTCTSEMSGTASSGVRTIAQAPQKPVAAAATSTRKRLRVHQSMMRSTMTYLTTRANCRLPSRCPPRETTTVASQRPAIEIRPCPR